MRPARLRTLIFPYSLAVTLIAVLAVTSYAVWAVRELHLRQTGEALIDKARLIEGLVRERLREAPTSLEPLVRDLGASVRARLTLVTPAGRVLADSDHAPGSMGDHSDRPEIRAALARGQGSATRYSQTLDRDMLYVAVRSPAEGEPVAVVRTALPLRTLAETVADTLEHVALVGLIAGLLAAGLGLVVARRLARPLEQLTGGAQAFAAGDLTRRLSVHGAREVDDLARAMNGMAAQLAERIATIDRQRDELQAVLESLVEGVVAVDADERVLRVNSACLRLLGIDPARAQGRTLQEVLRNPELERLVGEILACNEPREGEIHLPAVTGERTLEVHGALLRDPSGASRGAVLALHDVTRTRRLERVRRDFVANVSHELRTPVTVIKGSVETLLDGARGDALASERFLGIVQAEADRLESLLEDLLALSRLEQEGSVALDLEPASLRGLAREALAACEVAAREHEVTLVLADGLDVTVRAHPRLLVQAIVNLLDNAVKYSGPGTLTTVSVERAGAEAHLHVTDQGPGIPAEHLPRLFERFYRVDKGRSRAMGGTGLGLAIVKHIARAHGGRVAVESEPGRGCRFTVTLPAEGLPPALTKS